MVWTADVAPWGGPPIQAGGVSGGTVSPGREYGHIFRGTGRKRVAGDSELASTHLAACQVPIVGVSQGRWPWQISSALTDALGGR